MGREVSEDRGNESAFGEGALWYDILIPTLVGHKTPPERVGIKSSAHILLFSDDQNLPVMLPIT